MTEGVDDTKMPLLEHLIELRQRLLYCAYALFGLFIVCFFFAQDLYDFLAAPLQPVLGTDRGMVFTDLVEPFFAQIKVAFYFAFFFSFPFIEIQIWKFVAPGLYKHEKGAFLPFLIAAPVLFFIGASFVYFVIFPIAWQFFAGFEILGRTDAVNIELLPKVSEYLSLVMRLIFAFGLCFQLPVVMMLLSRAGLATAKGMAEKRKYAIVGVFVVAAIFTPPDPLSQLALAIPIIILYEISIHLAKITERKRAEREAALENELYGD